MTFRAFPAASNRNPGINQTRVDDSGLFMVTKWAVHGLANAP
ncbi:hypothetical protein [Corynebacterium sp. MNWGS58]